MKAKTIILLPLVVVLNACSILDNLQEKSTSDTNTHQVIIEDRGMGEVDAIEMQQANFQWRSDKKAINTDIMSKKELQKALATLTVNDGRLIMYFDYDVVALTLAINQEIIKHIEFMQANPEIRLRLEGHADERGTREYNLALGENRALSIKQSLGIALGDRIEVISYGEEKPVSDDYAKNRRVEFIYK